MGDLETVTLGNPLLKGFERRVLEFNNLSAVEADQVIVVASFGGGLISCLAILEFPPGGETQLGQKLEGAVNGNVADLRVGFNDLGIDLRKALVAGRIQEDVEDFFPLLGRLQPFFGDPCFKKIGFNRPLSF